jgi:hypothetical protein
MSDRREGLSVRGELLGERSVPDDAEWREVPDDSGRYVLDDERLGVLQVDPR